VVRVAAWRLMTIPYTSLDIRFDLSAAPPGVNPYSARGLRGTLAPIDQAKGADKLARTVNGGLVDLSAPQMRKYQLTITGNDQAPPALDGLWVGMVVHVDSLVEMAYLTTGGSAGRPAVSGSVRTEDAFTYYRPQFTMMVVDSQVEREEWEANVPWSLSLEEV
jgi:hypothetical protein